MNFIDLKTQYHSIQSQIQNCINTVLDHGQYIMGPEVKELEDRLAKYTGAKYCLSCSSGTDALLMALMAWGVGPGDAVFTSPFTFIATAEVVALLGATPIFVDIDPISYNIDTAKLEQAIINCKNLTPKAIIPVDLFGICADYDAIDTIAKKYNLKVLEDGCQSFGGSYNGKKSCSFGDAAATSFFPAKPLGAYGDAGAVFTNDSDTYNAMESIRIHGKGIDKYNNIRVGINGRCDTIQAAILLCKLDVFDQEIAARQEVAQRYSNLLAHKVTTPIVPNNCISAWAQYSVLSNNREKIMAELGNNKIPTAIYYPRPLHLQEAFSYLGYQDQSLPICEDIARKIFSLPMHPYLTEQEQNTIAEIIFNAS